jgi:hypothetical protein
VAPRIRLLVFVHAFVKSAWILLFIAQSLLIALHRKKPHIALVVCVTQIAH